MVNKKVLPARKSSSLENNPKAAFIVIFEYCKSFISNKYLIISFIVDIHVLHSIYTNTRLPHKHKKTETEEKNS